MTILSENRKSGPYDGNDVTTSFPFSFKVFSDDEVVVVFTDEDGVETILSSGYSVTLNADQNANPGGSVEKSTALETGAMLTITSAVQNLQPIDLTNNGGFYPAVINHAFDRLTILAQQNAEQISRAVKTPISSGMTPDELLASIASSYSAAAASASEAAASASDALSHANDAEASAVASAASVDALADDLASTDDGKGAELVAFAQAGTGAVQRTTQNKLRETVSIEDFGGKSGLSVSPSENDAAMLDALNHLESIGGGILKAKGQYYIFSAGILIPNGVTIEGSGVGSWDTVFPNRPKEWTGTNFIFKGTGEKSESFYGVTDRSVTGGWRPDTEIPANTYKLTNFMNSDSSSSVRATPRTFSAAISPKVRSVDDLHAYHWGLKNIRIVPWIGEDGIDDYSNTATSSLGNDWDVGLYVVNSEYEHFENVQVVGYWRIAGTLKVQPGATEWGSGERGSYTRFKTQGFRGLIIRGADNSPITASTSNSVEIPWTSSHFWPASGMFEIPGGIDYTYTGLTKTGDKLTFTGVTPDSSGLSGNTLRPYYRGTGVAGSIFNNVIVSGLCHVSGNAATDLGFSEHSIGFEVSGFPMRGLCFNDFKVQNGAADPCNSFFGDCDDVLMFGCQFENGKVVATPYKTEQTWATYPIGNTTDLRLYGHVWSADKTLFSPRSYFDDSEVFGPLNATNSTEDLTATQAGKVKVIKKNTAKALLIRDGDATDLFEIAASSGNTVIKNGRQLSFTGGTALINADTAQNLSIRNGTTTRLTLFGSSGNFAAGADNSQTWGTSSSRWSTIYAGSGTINTSDIREKQQIRSLHDAEKAVAIRLKGMIKAFKFNDAVKLKGDSARIHIGVMAQDVKSVFEDEGLDPFAYAILCFDEWESSPEELDHEGAVISKAIDGGNRYGVRYDELFAFIIGAL